MGSLLVCKHAEGGCVFLTSPFPQNSDTDRPSKSLICYFDYDSYKKMKLLK